MAVLKVEAFQTTDGKLFTNEVDAAKHQLGIKHRQTITDWVNDNVVTIYMSHDDDLELSVENVVSIILEYLAFYEKEGR